MIRMLLFAAAMAAWSHAAHAQITERAESCNPLTGNCGDAKTIGGVEAKPDAEAAGASRGVVTPAPRAVQSPVARVPKFARSPRPAKAK